MDEQQRFGFPLPGGGPGLTQCEYCGRTADWECDECGLPICEACSYTDTDSRFLCPECKVE
jgi:uncharacterized ferredoxin-like protein